MIRLQPTTAERYTLDRWVDSRATHIVHTQLLAQPSMMVVGFRLMPTAHEWHPSSEPTHALYLGLQLPSRRDRLDVFGAMHLVHVDNRHGVLVNLRLLHKHESPFLESILKEQFGAVIPQSAPMCVGLSG